ncbi:MAG: hypothetical protein ACOX1W_08495 [Catenisphaera adipataccumulans]|jgi:glucan-binding YG repeat protein|uniref:hypothetical protein n=1 Tax=Catenisphaera adipataccumulans TaxID=700500 RepID=UPI003D8B85DD
MESRYKRNLLIAASAAFIAVGAKTAALSIQADTVDPAETIVTASDTDTTDTSVYITEENEDTSTTESAQDETAETSEETSKTESTQNEIKENTNSTTDQTTLSRVQKNQSLYQSINETILNGWSSDYQKYYVDGTAVTGFKDINGSTYYFNEDGTKALGQRRIGDYWYCFLRNQSNELSNGRMVKSQFFDLNGIYHASWDHDKTAYYDENGHMRYKQQHIGKYWYCFDQYSGAMKTGFVNLTGTYHASWDKDKTAYYDQSGRMQYKQKYIDGYWYCFDQYSGAMKTGFVNLTGDYHASWDQDKTAYYDKNGHMLYKQQHIGKYWYCFDQYSGAMKTGFVDLNGTYHASWDQDKKAYYDQNGRMQYKQKYINGYWYCFDRISGAMKTGFVKLTGDYHAASEADKTVYYDENGHMLYGYQTINGKKYYFDTASGAMMTTTEWDGPVLNAYLGTVQGPSGTETYYNLDMSGVVSIMRSMGYSEKDYPYWVRSDGVKMLGDYIMAAANLSVHPRGSLVDTSLGKAIVCDTGTFAYFNPTQLDIATTW